MIQIKNILLSIFTQKFFQKLLAYTLLVLFIYLFADFAFLFVLTFIFAYLFFSLATDLKYRLDKYLMNKKYRNLFKINSYIGLLYIVFVWIIILILIRVIPQITKEITDLASQSRDLQEWIKKFVYSNNLDFWFWDKIIIIINDWISTISNDIPKVIWQIKNASVWFMQVMLALILSLIILLDRSKLSKYLLWIKNSNFKFFYEEYSIIFEKVVKSFGLILKAQSMIALVNSLLTMFWLFLIGVLYYFMNDLNFISFPYLLTLGLVVFLFWFVPVLWTFLSSVPILIVAYTTYWWAEIIFLIIFLIMVVHTIEAYILNPKIVSRFMNFPVSLTFIILIISEHTFWFAGLLIWVSMFYFFIWMFKDIDVAITNKRKMRKVEDSIVEMLRKEKMKKYD